MLGIAPTAKGYDIGYANENTHNKTQIWSKRKPVEYAQPGELSSAQFALGDKSYGLTIINKSTGSEIIGSLPVGLDNIKSLSNYEYRVNAPSAVSYKRLTDWDDYYHYASPAIYYAGGTKMEVNLFSYKNGSGYINIYLETNDNDPYYSKCVTLTDIKSCVRWSTLAYGKYHFCCFFVRGNLFYTAMSGNPLEDLDIELVHAVGKTESANQLGLYTYDCYLGLCSPNGDQILPIPQYKGVSPIFTITVISRFNGTCVIEKIGSYNGLFNGGDIRDTDGTNIRNYQPLSYYDENYGNNPLLVYNGTGVAFKLVVTIFETMNIDITEFGLKAYNLPNATEYKFWMQLSTEDVTRTNGNIAFKANTPVTLYAICVSANIFPPGTSYVPVLYCRGAEMAQSVELQIDNY